MIKKTWKFIKENVAAIIAIVTSILTVIYAALRLLLYVYWSGYFVRLNIDKSIMNLDFDGSIFTVIFATIIVIVILFFMGWVYQVIDDIQKKANEQPLKGKRRLFNNIKAIGKGLFLSLIILAIVNWPLIILLVALVGMNLSMGSSIGLFFLLYLFEMILLWVHRLTTKQKEKKDEAIEKDISIKIIALLAYVLTVLAILFSSGSHAINEKTTVQLVEDEEYMISYCDGERYVLHKVKYDNGEIIIYRNSQKIVGIENCKYRIRKVEKVILNDE